MEIFQNGGLNAASRVLQRVFQVLSQDLSQPWLAKFS